MSDKSPISSDSKTELHAGLKALNTNVRGRFRNILDKAAQRIISLGGVGVIATLLLLFVFLLYEVVPLFRAATIEQIDQFTLDTDPASQTIYLALEEQGEVAFRLDADGSVSFINVNTNDVISHERLPLPEGVQITSFAVAEPASGMLAFGLDDGSVLIFGHEYITGFAGPSNQRQITPFLNYPLGEQAQEVFDGSSVKQLALSSQDDGIVLAAINSQNELRFLQATRARNLIAAIDPSAASPFTARLSSTVPLGTNYREAFVDGDQRRLLLSGDAVISSMEIASVFNEQPGQATIESPISELDYQNSQLLLGGISLLSGASGQVHQYFLNTQPDEASLVPIRTFQVNAVPLVALVPEQRQKNFIAIDEAGWAHGFNTTAHREIFSAQIAPGAPVAVAVSPRGDRLLVEENAGQYSLWAIDNPHPDVSWSVLWDQIWYEGYSEPAYVWQSSATDNAFEPKFSLVPLSFGTLKAAFYVMLLAAPLAICGAVYTGYFMAPAMRRKVKPLIELMEALPTVVLGFLAGLWLAPFVELHLLSVFAILILSPLTILSVSFVWYMFPKSIRHIIPEGWEAGLLIPAVLFCGWFAFFVAASIEPVFFAGDIRSWLSNELGIDYDQRNAMVVGFAMGFAVIPTIFSIAEDAIFMVPRHLPYGSLALGATPWQSLCSVVLPTASPGIFSALMIGLGRAVGETMIVLMATGNTPIMDASIFEGMRTLAANIAIEIPESEVDSTHYRILFLAALVLFTFTFMINTVAEVVRQRLRGRYTLL